MAKFAESFAGMATSLNRVAELYEPADKRLFDDRFAFDLLPLGWRIVTRILFLPGLRHLLAAVRARRMPGTLGAFHGRTCYIDDVLRQWLSKGLDQVVILGAGFDSRAYRIAGMDQVQVFEVDLPGLCLAKQTQVERLFGTVPQHVIFVGIDFNQGNLDDTLTAAGFRPGLRTFYIWEGVTQYITAQAVDDTLRFVSSAAGQGSAVVFTYVRQGAIDGPDRTEPELQMEAMAARLGSPWTFGIAPARIGQFLDERGLELIEDVGADEYLERYFVPRGREMEVIDIERATLARVRV